MLYVLLLVPTATMNLFPRIGNHYILISGTFFWWLRWLLAFWLAGGAVPSSRPTAEDVRKNLAYLLETVGVTTAV